MVIPWNAA